MVARSLLLVSAPSLHQDKTLSAIAESAGLALTTVGDSDKAVAWLARNEPRAVVLDLRIAGVNEVTRKLRSMRKLCGVPAIALTRQLSDIEVARFFATGVDDVLPFEATEKLLLRLENLPSGPLKPPPQRGVAIIADPDPMRSDIFGRVFMNAGFDIKYAVDDRCVLSHERKRQAKVVVLSPKSMDPVQVIEQARSAGSQAVWVVIAGRRELDSVTKSLAGVHDTMVIARDAPPTDALYFTNEMLQPGAVRQRSGERRLYGTQVRFRAPGAIDDDFGFSYNVSENGIYVRTLAPPSGQRVWLQLRPPRSKEWVSLEAEVAWRRPFSAQAVAAVPPGFGARITGGLGDSLSAWQRYFREFAATPLGSGGGLAALVSKSLEEAGVQSALVLDVPLDAIPEWGADDDEPSTLDGLVTSPPAADSWEPVTLLEEEESGPGSLGPEALDLRPPRLPAEAVKAAAGAPPALPAAPPAPLGNAGVAAHVEGGLGRLRPVLMAAAAVVLVGGAGVALAEALGLGSSSSGASAPSHDTPRVANKAALPARAQPRPPKLPAAASDLAGKREQSARPLPAPVAEAPEKAQTSAKPEPAAAALELRADQGALTVTSNEMLEVYVQGVNKGMTGEPLAIGCGYKFVRLRASDSSPWRSAGHTVLIPCGKSISVTIQAGDEESRAPAVGLTARSSAG